MLNDLCKCCGTVMTVDWRKDYFTRRNKELIYCSIKCTHYDRKSSRLRVDQLEKITHCQRCKKEIAEDWRTDLSNRKYVPLRWCSKRCSNKRTLTAVLKQQISQTLVSYYKNNPKISIQRTPKSKVSKFRSKKCKKAIEHHIKICIQCGVEFLAAKNINGKFRKTCSTKCRNIGHSLRRQEYIRKHGSFATERHLFTYKDTTVYVDSKLERAAVIYMIDTLKASRIERYNNLINYRDGDANRTFNPDFICYINNKTHIVEVKQLWRGDQSHLYAKNIPLKREALKSFCDLKGYDMIWLDFNEAPAMKDIYRNILNLTNKVNK